VAEGAEPKPPGISWGRLRIGKANFGYLYSLSLMFSYRRYPLDFLLFSFSMLEILFCSLRMYCGSCLGNERADYRKRMLCDGLLSRL